jgi:hypothetical protein
MQKTKVIINGQETMPLFRTVSDAYRKKPVVVHARQIDKPFEVHTLEGIMKGKAGDWLIMGVEKELYPCDDKIFKKTYEKADAPKKINKIVDDVSKELCDQQDRIERMLKWLVIKLKIEGRGQLAGMNYSPEAMGKQIDELVGQMPDVSDIIKEKK